MPARPRPAVPVVPVSSSNNTVPEIVIASEAVVVSPPQPQPQPKVKPPKPPKPAFIPAPGNKSSHTSPPAQRSPRPNAVVSVDLATEQQAKPVVAEQQDEPVVAEQQAKPVVAEQQDEHVVLVTTSEQHSTDVVEPAKELSTDKEAVVLHEDLILPTAPENPFIDESALHVDPLETLHTDPPATHEPLHEETPKAEGAEENPFLEGPSSLGQEEVTPSNPFLDDVASTPPAANTAPARPPRNAAALADAVTETAVTLPVRPPRVTPSAAAPLPEAPEEEPQLTPTKPRMPPRRSFAPKPAVAQAATVTTADRPTEADNDLLTVQQPIPVLPVRPQSASANTSTTPPISSSLSAPLLSQSAPSPVSSQQQTKPTKISSASVASFTTYTVPSTAQPAAADKGEHLQRQSSASNVVNSKIAAIGESFGSVLKFSRNFSLRRQAPAKPTPKISIISAAPITPPSAAVVVSAPLSPQPQTVPAEPSVTDEPAPPPPPKDTGEVNPFLDAEDDATETPTEHVSTPVVATAPPVDENAWRGKRTNIMNEICDTEKSYGDDLEVLRDSYLIPCLSNEKITKHDATILFCNLLDLLQLSRDLTTQLEQIMAQPQEEQLVGSLFLSVGDRLAREYNDYCKNQDNANKLLSDLQQKPETLEFFHQCQESAAGRTNAWDLGSFLIKPVQRLLKYPLLLKDLHAKGTPPNHPDRQSLEEAIVRCADMANVINETKRRKDIVVKAATDQFQIQEQVSKLLRGETVNKKALRVAQMLGQVTGLKASSADPTFDELSEKLEGSEKAIRTLMREVRTLKETISDIFQHQLVIAATLEDMYITFGSNKHHVDPILNYRQTCNGLKSVFFESFSERLETSVMKPLFDLVSCYTGPQTVVKKRQRKRLDYDRCKDMESRNEKPEKLLKESAEAYLAINQQLVEELPIFLKFAKNALELIVAQLASVLVSHFEDVQNQLQVFTKAFYSDDWRNSIHAQIADTFTEQLSAVVSPFAGFVLLTSWNKAKVMMLSGTDASAALTLQTQSRSSKSLPVIPTPSSPLVQSNLPSAAEVLATAELLPSPEPLSAEPLSAVPISPSVTLHAERAGTILDVVIDYNAESLDDLSVSKDDRLVTAVPSESNEHRAGAEWYYAKIVVGTHAGHQGYVPAHVIAVVEAL